jgi:hypothetical protein
MKIYFDDPEYDGQFLRAVDYAPAGAQIGEAWAIAAQIQAGDKTSWYNEWSSYADRLYELAVKSRDAGHRVSARNAFLRASNYYRTAYIFMFAVPVDPRVVDAYEKQTDAFRKAAELFERPIEVLKIPYENTTLPGYFIKPDASGAPRKTLLCTGGYDGTCEELFFIIAGGALEHGYNVLVFDGPGQGGALVLQKLPMRPDWENVVTPVVDYLLKRRDVDPARIALYGGSFGGYLAPRAAAGCMYCGCGSVRSGGSEYQNVSVPILRAPWRKTMSQCSNRSSTNCKRIQPNVSSLDAACGCTARRHRGNILKCFRRTRSPM